MLKVLTLFLVVPRSFDEKVIKTFFYNISLFSVATKNVKLFFQAMEILRIFSTPEPNVSF